MRSLILLSALITVHLPAAAAPALVTLSKGSVTVAGEDAPNAPFKINDGQAIVLGEGASVIVLYEGTLTRLHGPATINKAQLTQGSTRTPGSSPGALDGLLSRKVSTARAGASRAGGLQLLRPVPGGTLLNPKGVSWRCAECGEQAVQIYDFMNDKIVWRGAGKDSTPYTGPALPPGPYLVRVGAHDFSFTVADANTQTRAGAAISVANEAVSHLKRSGASDLVERTSVPASIYLEAGLSSDALWLLDAALIEHPDDQRLTTLRAEYERRAGLPGAL